MKLCDIEGSQEATQEKQPQPCGQPVSDELIVERDYVRFLWPEDPDPFVVCLDDKKLKLVKERFPGLVIYSMVEIRELQKVAHCQNLTKKGHLVKKVFLGSTVDQCIPAEK